ncbi:MAG: peptidoglycan DD-metalloendopeptidase family protein [Sphingomonadales bacterium]|nr:peptidoglycan DD-metalloendopeptidase family protein [Sphingomonadales bacterium]
MRLRGSLPIFAGAALALGGCIPPATQPPAQRTARPAAPAPAPQTSGEPAAWQAQSVTIDAATVTRSLHIVRPGDTLGAIARDSGAGVAAIAAANNIAPPYVIQPGQRLIIPAGRYHRVRSGETGIAIARAYGVSWSEIAALNALEEPFVLHIDQRLRLPEARATPPATASREARARAFDIDIDDIITGGEPAIAAAAPAPSPAATPAATPAPSPPAPRVADNSSGRFGWPMTGAILSSFGQTGSGQRNDGINIAARPGTPVQAAADGTVIYAGNEIQVHGGLVLINHGDGWITAYANLDRLDVARGDRVRRGQQIGASGDTGLAPQPQLHFEIRRNRRPVDPMQHLPSLS